MNRRTGGFTIVELMIALAIGTILTGIVVAQTEPARQAAAVRAARQEYSALHARARATSIERGERILLRVDPVGDSAWIQQGTNRPEVLHFERELGVDLIAGGGIVMCMTPRGIANPDCGNVRTEVDLVFARRGAMTQVTLLPLGQLIVP